MKYDIKDLVRQEKEQTERNRKARAVDRLVVLITLLALVCVGVYLI